MLNVKERLAHWAVWRQTGPDISVFPESVFARFTEEPAHCPRPTIPKLSAVRVDERPDRGIDQAMAAMVAHRPELAEAVLARHVLRLSDNDAGKCLEIGRRLFRSRIRMAYTYLNGYIDLMERAG